MVRIAVCDDNEIQRELMEDILLEFTATCPAEIQVATFSGGRELLDAVSSKGAFDIYILDLIMPGINGMEVATTLRIMNDPGKIIFLTATLDYAVASYDVNAFYYMVKPVEQGKLFRVLNNAVDEILSASTTVLVRTPNGDVSLDVNDILYVDLDNRSLHYHMRDGRVADSLTIRTPFRDAVAPLLADSQFTLCGVSLVLNLRYIDTLDAESVLLRDGSLLYPSKAGCTALKKVWKDYLKK